ncbi:MAG: hypothetical protein V3U33_02515, partial [candidate division NC10 bacterium]
MGIKMEEKRISVGMVGVLIVFLVVSVGGCATYPRTSGRVVVEGKDTRVEVVFSERDRTLIHEYYRRRHLP